MFLEREGFVEMAFYLAPGFGSMQEAVFFDITVDRPLEQIHAGLLITSDAVSQPIRITSRHRKVPDLITFQASFYGVSAACLELFNEFAARHIMTFPISIVAKNGDPVHGEYYYLNVLEVRDSLIIDETNEIFQRTSATRWDGTPVVTRTIEIRKLKMKKRSIRDAHIWHERTFQFRSQLFFSDKLVNAARRKKLSGFQYCVPVTEI